MGKHGFKNHVHHRKPRGRPMAPHVRRGNAKRPAVRAAVEHIFAHQKGPMELTIRTIGITRAKTKIVSMTAEKPATMAAQIPATAI